MYVLFSNPETVANFYKFETNKNCRNHGAQKHTKYFFNCEILARLTFTNNLLFFVKFAGVGHREDG